MKRYRVLRIDFDTRANVLGINIDPSWEPQVQALHREAQEGVLERVRAQFGTADDESKIRNFLDLGAAPFSIVAYHNRFSFQARNAFVVGSYYPALTATCALGERVLNRLVIELRDDFKKSPTYKSVAKKKSFDKWDTAIDALASWNVLELEVPELFRELRDIRNGAIHFRPETDTNDRQLALSALRVFGRIVDRQFTARENGSWYIPAGIGISFVRRDAESAPFVRRVLLPNCALVGPDHRLTDGPNWQVDDPSIYPDREVTDEEYIRLFKEGQAGR